MIFPDISLHSAQNVLYWKPFAMKQQPEVKETATAVWRILWIFPEREPHRCIDKMEFYMVFYPDGIHNSSVITGRKIPDIPALHRENASFHSSSVIPCGRAERSTHCGTSAVGWADMERKVYTWQLIHLQFSNHILRNTRKNKTITQF